MLQLHCIEAYNFILSMFICSERWKIRDKWKQSSVSFQTFHLSISRLVWAYPSCPNKTLLHAWITKYGAGFEQFSKFIHLSARWSQERMGMLMFWVFKWVPRHNGHNVRQLVTMAVCQRQPRILILTQSGRCKNNIWWGTEHKNAQKTSL